MCVREKKGVYKQIYEWSLWRKKKKKKRVENINNLLTHSDELGFLAYIHIFVTYWKSGAVAFANVHLPCYLLLLYYEKHQCERTIYLKAWVY